MSKNFMNEIEFSVIYICLFKVFGRQTARIISESLQRGSHCPKSTNWKPVLTLIQNVNGQFNHQVQLQQQLVKCALNNAINSN